MSVPVLCASTCTKIAIRDPTDARREIVQELVYFSAVRQYANSLLPGT